MRVGIDLGTTYSAIAYVNDSGNPEIIKLFDEETTPSVVAFDQNGAHIGWEAKQLQEAGLKSVVSAFKRHMGEKEYSFEYDGRQYDATDLSVILLKGMKEEAERQTGKKIDKAVITVPAYFNDLQKSATLEAGKRAGLDVMMLIHEPTAASVCYGMKNAQRRTVMTYDLGGGTFDITILRIDNGNIEVLGTLGDSNLGGKDWDGSITDILAEQFEDQFDEDLKENEVFLSKFSVESENIKKKLSIQKTLRVPLYFNGKKMDAVVDREDFESRTCGLVQSTVDLCEKLLDDLNMKWNNLTDIILVGGSTRLPAIRNAIKEVSGVNVIVNADTDTAVAKGAALFSLADEGVVTLKRKTPNNGAGPSAASAQDNFGYVSKIQVNDVIAHSLGALAVNKAGTAYVNDIIIKRSSKIPVTAKRAFKIEKYNRTDKIEIYTMQGEESRPLECTVLALVTAEDIRNDGNGLTIDIEYSYDRSGIVNVNAFQDGRPLTIKKHPVPEDISWMGRPIEKKKAPKPQDMGVVFAIDLSGSMAGEPIRNAKAAISKFIKMLPNATFSLIPYASNVRTVCSWVGSKEILSAVDRLDCSSDYGYGNEEHPFDDAYELWKKWNNRGPMFIITLTDGCWYCRTDPVAAAQRCMRENIGCIAVGFGSANRDFLKKISSMDEGALMTSSSGLVDTFSTIASTIESGGFRSIR